VKILRSVVPRAARIRPEDVANHGRGGMKMKRRTFTATEIALCAGLIALAIL
jgi:hypothetical protein